MCPPLVELFVEFEIGDFSHLLHCLAYPRLLKLPNDLNLSTALLVIPNWIARWTILRVHFLLYALMRARRYNQQPATFDLPPSHVSAFVCESTKGGWRRRRGRHRAARRQKLLSGRARSVPGRKHRAVGRGRAGLDRAAPEARQGQNFQRAGPRCPGASEDGFLANFEFCVHAHIFLLFSPRRADLTLHWLSFLSFSFALVCIS